MNDMTILRTDKWSSHFVKRNTFQKQLCDSEPGYIYNEVSQMHTTDMHLIH